MKARTGAERYLDGRLEDPDYHDAYHRAGQLINHIDSVIQALDARRSELNLSKAELARRAEMPPEAVRRLFSAERPNPTLRTLAALAEELDMQLVPLARDSVKNRRSAPSRGPLGAAGTRRRSA